MTGFTVAVASVKADGTWRLRDEGFTGVPSKLGTGIYEVTLLEPIQTSECCPIVSIWHPNSAPSLAKFIDVTLLADLITLHVETRDSLGLAIDSAFCVSVLQVLP